MVVDLLGWLTRQRWLAREEAWTAMARPHRLPGRWHGRKVQVGVRDHPRRQRHPLARWQGPLPDQPLDPRRTDPALLGCLLKRQPVLRLGDMRQTIRIPPTRDTGRSPGFPGPGAIAHTLERGRNRQVTTDVGERADHRHDLVSGRTAMRPSRLACDVPLGVSPAVPVPRQDVLGWLLGGVDEHRMQHRAQQAFCERLWR
jgi:hypothetical protein